MEVTIKHAGRQLPIQVNVDGSALDFKQTVSEATGVPIDRLKIMLKTGVLKDDSNLSKAGLKPGQLVTAIGSSAALPSAPTQLPVFLEDLGDGEVAQQNREPSGLVNLGQTCYLNSSLQALRQIPQLQAALEQHSLATRSPEARFTMSMRNLFSGLERATQAVPPLNLLNELRTLAPQFAEMDPTGRGFAQQDADEAWTQIISALRHTLRSQDGDRSFIEEYMSTELTKTLQCVETTDEVPTTVVERVLKLECNISIATNFLTSGLLENLDQVIEKNSPTLNRTATYQQRCRLSRLPEYLPIHMVRFYWRRDIQKKAKIMRKVKFPLQLDASELATDDLRSRIQPVNAAVKSVLQARDDRAKQLKTARNKAELEAAEDGIRSREKASCEALIAEGSISDPGSNPSGLYELCALVTHKGASADSGHYIGWSRCDATAPKASGEEDWYKYDDDKVSTVSANKILAMDGGGQDSVAYILLYRAVRL